MRIRGCRLFPCGIRRHSEGFAETILTTLVIATHGITPKDNLNPQGFRSFETINLQANKARNQQPQPKSQTRIARGDPDAVGGELGLRSCRRARGTWRRWGCLFAAILPSCDVAFWG